jgi:hypothetical protein
MTSGERGALIFQQGPGHRRAVPSHTRAGPSHTEAGRGARRLASRPDR